MNDLEIELIDTLLSERNIFDLIKLSKKYSEIKLEKYFNYIPSININYDWLDYDKKTSGFKSYTIHDIESFKLNNDNTIFTDKSFFLQNIEDVCEINIFNHIFIVEKGKLNASQIDIFFYIEFSLHNIHGPALYSKEKDYYCLHERLISKDIFKMILRKLKINKFLDGEHLTLEKLITEEEDKSRSDFLDEKRKKRKEAQNKYTYVEYNSDMNIPGYLAC